MEQKIGSDSSVRVVGIDLGGTNARAVLARGDGRIEGEVSRPSESAGPPERTFDIMAECVAAVLSEQGVDRSAVAAIGVGMPGIVTPDGESPWNPNFPLWGHVPARQLLEKRTSLRCFFLNDARCATLGELHLGAGRGVESMVYVGLGTGVGGGLVLDGELLLGRHGAIGEIGHHTIDPDGPLCACGNYGCWEAFVGRDRIVRRALLKLQAGRASSLLSAPDDGRGLTPRIIGDAAASGDAVALEVLEETGHYVGIGVANLINVMNPQRVVVGGGVAQAGDLLFAPMRRTVQARALPYQRWDCDIVPAQLGSDAGVRGAVVLALTRVGEPPKPRAPKPRAPEQRAPE
ncbi:MAG: ROK family protein, partial [Chloroflexi bacterium]|nr:ROK family protein [Chloroflexota bacterium]